MTQITDAPAQELLNEVVKFIKKARIYLESSYKKIEALPIKEKYTEHEIELIEVFTARFSRFIDLLLKKAYRTLDNFELLEGGTLIDTVHRAEKRGLVDSLEQIRNIKDVRNMIAHEYAGDNFLNIFIKTKTLAPQLFELGIKFEKYCHNIISTN